MGATIANARTELKVVAVVVGTLLCVELAVRLAETHLSKDVEHIRSIPRITEKLETRESPRLLFLGNSIVRYGIDAELFKTESEKQGVRVAQAIKVNPDASSLVEWYYYFRRYFADTHRTPDVVFIAFNTNQLDDRRPVRENCLGTYCCDISYVPEVFDNDVTDFEARSRFLLSMYSVSFASHDRVQKRVFDQFIPGYREFTDQTNHSMQIHAMKKSGGVAPPATYQRLERVIDLAESQHAKPIIVAMPTREPYEIDPSLRTLIEAKGASLLDCRDVPDLKAGDFLDDIHLNPNGSVLLTKYLSKQWCPLTKEKVADNR